MIRIEKQQEGSGHFAPLEPGRLTIEAEALAGVMISDGAGRIYLDRRAKPAQAVRFRARGVAGRHTVFALDADDEVIEEATFLLRPVTRFDCRRGPYADLAHRLQTELVASQVRPTVIGGKPYQLLICWSRDHVYTLKSQRYFLEDVTSGMDFFLERQAPAGWFWDCIYRNPDWPGPAWLGEALGEGFFTYEDDNRYIIRRIPILRDVEFCITEGVWWAWKASGDDQWMANALPKLEKALAYNSSDPFYWSGKHGLVHSSARMDGWDFANPHYCAGDHRCRHDEDPWFFFHGDQSGLYSIYWRLAAMHEHLGRRDRAAELREEGEALRKRANKKLYFGNHYGHHIPEGLPERVVYKLIGDERERMSLSTGYTINRGLPTHEMAVEILKEYQRRGRAKKDEAFAEWFTLDPPYTPEQWPGHGPPMGEYMNGAICPLVAGELAKAAFDHGMEDYGADILQRLWQLSERDGGHIHQAYKRLPEAPPPPRASFEPIDLRPFANVGLRHGAHDGVPAWTDEGANDMRNLPTGRRKFGEPAVVDFDVIDPKKNESRSIVRLDVDPGRGVPRITVPVDRRQARSIYFMHTLAHSAPRNGVVGYYDVCYADGTEHRIHIRNNQELGLWWGVTDGRNARGDGVNRATTRVAWRGANGQWKNVGLHVFGWDNPHPEKTIAAIRCTAVPARPAVSPMGEIRHPAAGGIMLAAISLSDSPVEYETSIRSYGLPDHWSQAAVYHAIAEGLAGVEDAGSAFSHARIAPRWAATESDRNEVCLAYPASGGYVAYQYRLDEKKRRITLEITGSFDHADLHVLLPGRAKVKRVTVDGEEVDFEPTALEGSQYADFTLDDPPLGPVTVEY
jgi:hypothetical protein